MNYQEQVRAVVEPLLHAIDQSPPWDQNPHHVAYDVADVVLPVIEGAKLDSLRGAADLMQSALNMLQAGVLGPQNVLSDEKAAGFQLAVDNLTNLVKATEEEINNEH